MLVAQGKLDEALKSYRDSLAIAERAWPPFRRSNTGWQRDLPVSLQQHWRRLVAQGKLDEALKATGDGLAIAERVAASDRSSTDWRAISLSHGNIPAACWWRRAARRGAQELPV